MSYADYEKARKQGEKAFRNATLKGWSPYLPVLDEILVGTEIKGEMNLGLISIPLDRVVGTSTAGRTNSFANNFMPILDNMSEFATKWSNLCDAHVEEGIHDPIKVIEYLNYYYVIEGNKRVSVLKYFGADSVPAHVTRKIPQKTSQPEIKIYYEFMDFYAKTGVNYIWFTKTGSFQHLIDLVNERGAKIRNEKKSEAAGNDASESRVQDDKAFLSSMMNREGASDLISKVEIDTDMSQKWTEDDTLDFSSAYRRFVKVYEAKGGKKLEGITAGDAFLALADIVGYDKMCDMLNSELQEELGKIWEEFRMLNEADAVSLSLVPPEEKKKNLIQAILKPEPTAEKPLRCAFIYDRDPSTSDWLYGHELGRVYLEETFGKRIEAFKVTNATTDEEAVELIEKMIEENGCEVIFVTTSRLVDASHRCAVNHPNVKVLNCSLNTSHKYIRTYYARIYEAKFLSGMIAGAMTHTNKIGYFADYPIYGVTADINAFALGAKMMNPKVEVHLHWTTTRHQTKESIYQGFYKEGIDFVSDQDLITPRSQSRQFGMYKLTDGEPVNIALPVYNWGSLYEKLIRIITSGTWDETKQDAGNQAINYWWGISAGVVDLILSKHVPTELARLINTMKNMIREDRFSPFGGELIDQNGNVLSEDGQELTPTEIMTMSWLMNNVVGEIPEIDELQERAKEIVELKGVRKEDEE